MRDMNFFSDMSLEQKRAKSRLMIIVISLLAIAILLIGLFLGVSLYFEAQERDLASRQAYLDSPAVAQQEEEIDQLQQEIAALEGSEQVLTALGNYLSHSPRLRTAVLDALTSSMPDDVIISSISISQGSISLSATSEDERSPLVFSAALKENPYFTSVYLSGISRNSSADTMPVTTEPVDTEDETTDEPDDAEPGDAEDETIGAPDDTTTDNDDQQATVSAGSYSFSISCSILSQIAEEGDAQ